MKPRAFSISANGSMIGLVFGALILLLCCCTLPVSAAPIRVVIWDEQQPEQKKVYPNFIGNHLADHLRARKGFSVVSVKLNDPEQGLCKATLDNCDVLIWWGHIRHPEVKTDLAKDIARRVKEGRIGFLALHATHWSNPFIEIMNERAREDALKALHPDERATAIWRETNLFAEVRTQPGYTDRLTPYAFYEKAVGKPVKIRLTLANCCFPAVRGDGKPCYMRTLAPNHPIAKGVPKDFVIAESEMYGEPFHIPTPDAVIFDQRWEAGEWFRGGCTWTVGKGKVFYFQPGHETYTNFKDPNVLRIIENSVRWLAKP